MVPTTRQQWKSITPAWRPGNCRHLQALLMPIGQLAIPLLESLRAEQLCSIHESKLCVFTGLFMQLLSDSTWRLLKQFVGGKELIWW